MIIIVEMTVITIEIISVSNGKKVTLKTKGLDIRTENKLPVTFVPFKIIANNTRTKTNERQ